jgi:hypothetical protein
MTNNKKSMTKVSDLKPGDVIYDIDEKDVKWYTYLSVHPNNKMFHILINQFEDPVRMHEYVLQVVLDRRLTSYDIALGAFADRMELQAQEIRIHLVKKKENKV